MRIPRQRNERRSGPCDQAVERLRNRFERLLNRLKRFRRLAARYDKRAENYRAVWLIAATILWP
jgi:transposase